MFFDAILATMDNNLTAHPPRILVFDSGLGGLSIYQAIRQQHDYCHFIYISDNAAFPYGTKTEEQVIARVSEILKPLEQHYHPDILVIACNTASALALDAIQDAVSVPVLGVIEPGAMAARAASHSSDVLVIATDATVQSHAYAAACNQRGLHALEKACPLLVPLVEEGWTNHPVTAEVIRIYLDELGAEAAQQGLRPDTLVLGCTHYPLLRPLIERTVSADIRVIDSAEATAEAAWDLIDGHGAHAEPAQTESVATTAEIKCFATDSVDKFERLGSRFLGHPVGRVTLVDLGG